MSIDMWWTIDNDSLLAMLRRCANGDDPDTVIMEEYANSNHEYNEDDDA